MKKLMMWLGLGPDEAYEDYGDEPVLRGPLSSTEFAEARAAAETSGTVGPLLTKVPQSNTVRAIPAEPTGTVRPLEAAATAKVGCLMIVIMLAMGALAGYVIYFVWPDKIFESLPVTGISLLITPLVIGGLMSLWGICKLSLNYASSFPATFWGGALFGLAAAGTRLALLA